MALAKQLRPDVLVLVLFGKDMEMAIRQATLLGLKAETQIVVPNLTLGAAEGAGPKVMEGVIGALPWSWNLAYERDWRDGKAFVEHFAERHHRYPCTAGASAYVIVHQFKAAAERAGSLAGAAVVRALEGWTYTGVKDPQTWRAFDHQSVQSVFAVRCRPQAEVLKDRFRLAYFQTLAELPGERAMLTQADWTARRAAATPPLPAHLEPLAGQ